MPEHTLKERLAKQTNLTSSADQIAALDAAEQGTGAAPAAVAAPQVVEEKIGLGEAAFDSVAAAEAAQIMRKIKALKGKPKAQAPLIERLAVLRAEAAARLAAEQGAQ